MAKIDIETYRGFEITFDTNNGKFSAWSDTFDDEFTEPSFASVKKGIDDYIKKNNEFRPFKIQQLYDYGSRIQRIDPPIRVVGIRKDKQLVIEVEGKKKQLSKYDTEKYVIYNPANDKIAEELKAFKKREKETIDKLNSEEKEILSKVTFIKTLKEKRDEILNLQQ